MSPVNVDYRAHADAIRALLVAALPPDRVFDADAVPGSPPNAGTLPPIYVVPHLSGMTPEFGQRTGGTYGHASWRINVSISGRTADEVRVTVRRVREALAEQVLMVGDGTAWVDYVLDTLPERDEGRYFASIEFTYTL